MPERIIFPEFRDELEFTRYPFADGAAMISDDDELPREIELDTFFDASLYPIGAKGRLYIPSITVTPRKITIKLSDETYRERATAEYDPLDAPEHLLFEDKWGRAAGVIVSDAIRLARFSAWENKEHLFSLGATELAASCVIPTPEPGVRGVLTEKGELFVKDLWIVGDNGVVVRKEDDDKIRVDIVGDPLFVRAICEVVERFEPPLFIKTINGCPPDPYGNFHLTVGGHLNEETIVRVYPSDDGLVIEAIGQRVKAN